MVITFSGAPGVGKTTIVRRLLEQPHYRFLMSRTTRSPRPTDIIGEYEYLTSVEYQRRFEQDQFIWSVDVHGARYAYTRHDILDIAKLTDTIWVAIVVPEKMKDFYPLIPADQIIAFHLLSPGEHTLRDRLTARGDSPEAIEARLTETRNWDTYARGLNQAGLVRFEFIEPGSKDEMYQAVCAVIHKLTVTS